MTIPHEIASCIFSYLSFEERIRLTAVCKQWQHLLLDAPEMWNSISHEQMISIADTLTPYRHYIRPSYVRSLTLLKPWVEPDEEDDEDFIREIKNASLEEDVMFLEHCTHIQQIHIDSSYWSRSWMNKLYTMAHASLVNLTIQCSDQDIASRVLHLGSILEQFPLLERLSLTCPILFQHLQEPRIALWDTDHQGTHDRLVDLHIDLYGNKNTWFLPLEHAVMHFPQLRRLSIHPRDYDEPSRIIQALMDYCIYIDTISIFVESANDPLYADVSQHPFSMIKSHYQQHHQDLRHLFLQDTAAHPHVVGPIIYKHSSTLETLALRTSDTNIHQLLTSISHVTMPQLRAMRLLNQSLSYEPSISYADVYHAYELCTLFARHPHLERLAVLDNPSFTDSPLRALCYHHLSCLELQRCDISQKALFQFLSTNGGGGGARSCLSKLVLIDISGVTDEILDLIKQLPNLNHVTILKNRISFSAVVSFLEEEKRALDTNQRKRYDFMGLECTKNLGYETDSSYTTEDILAMLDLVATIWHFQYQEQ
ncbi:hypothetical protein K492DRAFT_190031 [Lichtheimia hyalospora FSU 10163]|nr:hypothetical protein K492DRAFT_190031 [Lichtheimia hyalospora FSU 10163]